MCGIFGFSGKENKKANINKILLLGIYNTSRGVDSCGYYYSGKIVKEAKDLSDFKDLAAYSTIKRGDFKPEVFIGHTRKASMGTTTEENAHPHIIDDDYIQVHNGTITNIWSLCNQYKINHTKITVDSMALAKLINSFGYSILNEYVGDAALVMTRRSNPESIFLYHGASRVKANGAVFEERPLFYVEHSEGIYFSSMRNSLSLISSESDIIKTVPCNKVIEVKNGEVINDKVFIVDRENKNIKEPIEYNKITYYGYNYNKSSYNYSHSSHRYNPPKTHLISNGNSNTTKSSSNIPLNKDDEIFSEDKPKLSTDDINTVYFHKGRYFKGSGILLHGDKYIRNNKIYYPTKEEIETIKPRMYSFYEGVMLKRQYKMSDVPDTGFISNVHGIKKLSSYSRYPVICLESEIKSIPNNVYINSYLWLKDGNPVRKETFHPIFSNKSYSIKEGRTVKIQEKTSCRESK